jgi:hypothetical protein
VGHIMPTKRPRGMEIMNIDIQNQCMLSKWLYKLINKNGICQELLRMKYMSKKSRTGSAKTQGLSILGQTNEC